MADLTDIEQELATWLKPYIQGATAEGRREFGRAVSRYLWRSQSNRIRDQKNPDGSPFESRKKGRKAMFEKIRKRRNLRARYNDTEVSLFFISRISGIAKVHQRGLFASPKAGQERVRYPVRELLGYTKRDIDQIKNLAEATLLPR